MSGALEVLGDFVPVAGILHIRLHTRPKWSAAQAVSQYVSSFLDADLKRSCGSPPAAQAMAADIAYAVSELMENAAKYSAAGTVEFCAGLQADEVVLSLKHAVAAAHAKRYRNRAADMTTQDPTELLIATVERNALHEDAGSGLGLLSLMSDYGARLGWAFESDEHSDVCVTTQARLPLRH